MHVVNSYIIEQPQLLASRSGTTPVNQESSNQKVQQARDSYRKNAANAQIIEAEYVDYPAKAKSLLSNPTIQHTPVPLEQSEATIETALRNKTNPDIGKYQKEPLDTPLPGTYINTFA